MASDTKDRILDVAARLFEAQGFEAGPKLLAEHFDVSEEDVIDVQAALDSRDVSIDAPVASDDERTREELLPDDRVPSVEEEVGRRELRRRSRRPWHASGRPSRTGSWRCWTTAY